MTLQPVRVQDKKKRKRQTKPKRAGSQTSLVTGRTARNDASLDEAKRRVECFRFRYEIAREIVEEGFDVTLIALDLERWGDQRLGEDWMWLLSDLNELEDCEDAPSANDYEFGSYWTGHSKGSEEYVRARAKWFLPRAENDLEWAEEILANTERKLW